MKEPGYVFISHSHKDLFVVREIRNQLESLGFEPLLFYLKCLSDDDVIEDLIKKEINARKWFLYVDTPNARNSKWVSSELAYVNTLEDKKVFALDGTKNLKDIQVDINELIKKIKVFISNSCVDKIVFDFVKKALLANEVQVLFEDFNDTNTASPWMEETVNKINEASHDGYVTLILTENSCKSSYVKLEIEETASQGGKILPIKVGNFVIPHYVESLLGSLQFINLDPNDIKNNNVEEFSKILLKYIQKM